MAHILKVFVDKAEHAAVSAAATVLEKYGAFLLVEASEQQAQAITRTYPTEDITGQYRLEVEGRKIETAAPRINRAGETVSHPSYGRGDKPGPGPHHYLVQFIGPIKSAWLAGVKKAGGELRVPLGSFAYVVRAREAALPGIAALRYVRFLGHLPHRARIAREPARALPRTRIRPGVYAVQLFDVAHLPAVRREAKTLGFRVLAEEPKASLLIVETDASAAQRKQQIEALSAAHGVRQIRRRALPRTSNDVATGIMSTPGITGPGGLNLSGKGEIIAVCDTGLDSGSAADLHPDFSGRVIAIKSYPITDDWSSLVTNAGANDGPSDLDSGHGTHVAGSVLGNGAASAPAVIRGLAHQAKLVFQAVEQEMKWRPSAPARWRQERYELAGIPNDLRPLFQFAYTQGARIHSNSWGGGDPGVYDDQCEQIDRFIWNHKDFSVVVAAGNDGTDSDGDGRINPMSVTSPATAKNVITVGASESVRSQFNSKTYGESWPDDYPVAPFHNDPMANNAQQVVAFSSRGPTQDGRTKPEILAPGTFILSTRSRFLAPNNFAWAKYPPNKLYFYMGGTSMSTPLTSGAVALVREFYRTKRGVANPTAALLKGTLIAGALRLPGGGAGVLLDNHQGFGRVNLERSLARILVSREVTPGLKTGQSESVTINVPAGGLTLRLCLCYSDYPGPALVNNLNLLVTAPSGKRYVGNQGPATGLTLDTKNNVEVVQVNNAPAGAWKAEVVASNVSAGRQDFALVAVLV
ncbi:MAG: S8 family serine peptidase [Bryobacteraceae bacterium]